LALGAATTPAATRQWQRKIDIRRFMSILGRIIDEIASLPILTTCVREVGAEERFMAEGNSQRIVDAHIHWFRTDNPYEHDHGRNYLPENYLADAAGYNVVGIVHIEAHWDPKDGR
jgi:hypothetical protein